MKFVILLASVAIQACIGGLYAWSSFVPALREVHGLSTAQTQAIFGGLTAVFTVSMVFAGRMLNRRGPRFVAGIGGALFGGGYVAASLSGGSFPVMLFGISLLGGVGTGFCYVCALAMCVRWFPARKGLATGFAVAGFGGGAILLSRIAETLFARGMDVLPIFRWVGLCYGIAILAAASLMRSPPHHHMARVRPGPPLGFLLRDPFFWALAAGMFCGTSVGMFVIGNLKPIALAARLSPEAAAAAIGAFAVGNAAGRITWGWVADRVGRVVIPLSSAVLAVSVAALAVFQGRTGAFAALSAFVGFGFGACFVTYAAETASRYGPDRVGNVYPLVFLAYGVAGIAGPTLGGWIYDVTGSYTPAVILGGFVVLAGLFASVYLFRVADRFLGTAAFGEEPAFSEEQAG